MTQSWTAGLVPGAASVADPVSMAAAPIGAASLTVAECGRSSSVWQLHPVGFAGHLPALNETHSYDPEKARDLLVEAGYGDGFELQLDSPPPGTHARSEAQGETDPEKFDGLLQAASRIVSDEDLVLGEATDPSLCGYSSKVDFRDGAFHDHGNLAKDWTSLRCTSRTRDESMTKIGGDA